MLDEGVNCLARAVLFGKEQLVLLRPIDELIELNILNYASEVRQLTELKSEVGPIEYSADELRLTKMLVSAARPTEFDIESFTNEYNVKLMALIEAKIAGEEIIAVADEPAPVINLMDALRASVEQAKQGEKVSPKMAASTRQRSAARRKKKSG